MRRVILFVTAVFFCLVGPFRADALSVRPAVPQTPESLCRCAGDDSPAKGGIRTFDEFNAKFGATFPTRAELELAWNVYKAVNRCDSMVVLGRLADTGDFEGKPGYCVLRSLEGWTMRVNQAFVRAATDRGARIQLVSEMPPETMSHDVDLNSLGPEDRESNWKVVYNAEIGWVLESGRYHLKYDKNKKITPTEPGYLEPGPSTAGTPPAVSKAGTLKLVEITPDPKCETWNFYTSCDPKAGRIAAKASWGTATYQWTPPPDQIGKEGFTIDLSVSEQTPPQGRVATGINLIGGDFELDPPQATIPIGAPNQPLDGHLTVKIKAPKDPAGDHYLKIGVYWGPGFTYHYRGVP
jgi:hypothetical protein